MLTKNIVDILGLSVQTLDSGGKKPVVFFLHGNSGSAELLWPLLDESLLSDYRCIALDFPGHGGSKASVIPERDYSVPAFATLLAALTQQWVQGPYVLVGHSLGGHVASAALPALKPAAGLMLISAPPINATSMGDAFRPDPTDGSMFARELSPAAVERFANALVDPTAISEEIRASVKQSIQHADVAFRPALWASIMRGDLADERANVEGSDVPTCLVFGSEDPFLHVGYARGLTLKAPFEGGVTCFDGSGHSPHLDAQQRFRALLRRFIRAAFDERRALVPEPPLRGPAPPGRATALV